MRILLPAAVAAAASPAVAQLPDYGFDLVATTGVESFQTDAPGINNAGQVVVGFSDVDFTNPGVFVGDGDGGRLVAAPGTDSRFDLEAASINNLGTAFFGVAGGTGPGIYTVPVASGPATLLGTLPPATLDLLRVVAVGHHPVTPSTRSPSSQANSRNR